MITRIIKVFFLTSIVVSFCSCNNKKATYEIAADVQAYAVDSSAKSIDDVAVDVKNDVVAHKRGPVSDRTIVYKSIKAFVKGTNEPVPEDVGRIDTFVFKNGNLYFNGKKEYKFKHNTQGSVKVYEHEIVKQNFYSKSEIKISEDLSRVNWITSSIGVSAVTEIVVYTNDLGAEEDDGLY